MGKERQEELLDSIRNISQSLGAKAGEAYDAVRGVVKKKTMESLAPAITTVYNSAMVFYNLKETIEEFGMSLGEPGFKKTRDWPLRGLPTEEWLLDSFENSFNFWIRRSDTPLTYREAIVAMESTVFDIGKAGEAISEAKGKVDACRKATQNLLNTPTMPFVLEAAYRASRASVKVEFLRYCIESIGSRFYEQEFFLKQAKDNNMPQPQEYFDRLDKLAKEREGLRRYGFYM